MNIGGVRVENLTGNPGDTKVYDAQTGQPISYVVAVELRAEAQKMPSLVLELLPGPFVWAGKPELRGELVEALYEIRHLAEAPQISTFLRENLNRWGDRIERAVIGAYGFQRPRPGTSDAPPAS